MSGKPCSAPSTPKKLSKLQFHVEVAVAIGSKKSNEMVSEMITAHFEEIGVIMDGPVSLGSLNAKLQDAVLDVRVEETGASPTLMPCPISRASLRISVYSLSEDPVEEEYTEDEGSMIPALNQWEIPNREFLGSWESLYFDSQVKSELLDFTEAAMFFADQKVDTSIICWNRVVLLHGPPGTGKTTLARALAHKLGVRLSGRYPRGQLLEINAHSLFSKYFSESGKLVLRLFAKIRELLEETDTFITVLVDEVESLTAARSAGGSEPTDQVRVVNAVLTQLDSLRHFDNCLVVATTNITGAIDGAFLDRADMKIAVGPPPEGCRYDILRSCVEEMAKKNVLKDCPLPLPNFAQISREGPAVAEGLSEDAMRLGRRIRAVAQATEGFSGRSLRKLPIQAYGLFVRKAAACRAEGFIETLVLAAAREVQARDKLDVDHMAEDKIRRVKQQRAAEQHDNDEDEQENENSAPAKRPRVVG